MFEILLEFDTLIMLISIVVTWFVHDTIHMIKFKIVKVSMLSF